MRRCLRISPRLTRLRIARFMLGRLIPASAAKVFIDGKPSPSLFACCHSHAKAHCSYVGMPLASRQGKMLNVPSSSVFMIPFLIDGPQRENPASPMKARPDAQEGLRFVGRSPLTGFCSRHSSLACASIVLEPYHTQARVVKSFSECLSPAGGRRPDSAKRNPTSSSPLI